MQRYDMGSEGLSFSQLIAGFWRLDSWELSPQQRLSLIEHYVGRGVTTMDHADIYGGFVNEKLFGEALALKPSLRRDIELVTKCDIAMMCDSFPQRKTGYYDTSKDYIIASAERSLTNFGTDHIDVLLLHRPDPLMAADEVAEAFAHLKASGKVGHFGVSNFTPSQFSLLQSRLEVPLVTNQVEVNLMNKSLLHDGTLDDAQQRALHPMVWSPLAGGELFWGESEKALRVQKQLAITAEEIGVTATQIAFAWLLKLPCGVLPIIGSGKQNRIEEAVESCSITLTREQWFGLWEASEGAPVP